MEKFAQELRIGTPGDGLVFRTTEEDLKGKEFEIILIDDSYVDIEKDVPSDVPIIVLDEIENVQKEKNIKALKKLIESGRQVIGITKHPNVVHKEVMEMFPEDCITTSK